MPFHLTTFAARGLALAAVVLAVASELSAAPVINSLTVRGLQVGGTTTIRIDGSDLLPNPRLLMSVPIAQQTLKPNPTATRIEFDVTLAADVRSGLCNFWVVTDSGAAAAEIIAVDGLPSIPFTAEVAALPVALHGVVSGSSKVRTMFAAARGQAVLLEVESQRLGGKLRPVLHIYDSSNRHLKWSLPSTVLRGDTRLKFTAPNDGNYTVELHDLQYAAPALGYFRLKIGTWQYADQAFPPAIERARPAQVQLLGNLPAGHMVDVASGESPEGRPLAQSGSAVNAFQPPVLISDLPELVEAAPAEGLQQLPSAPFGISGRLLAEGEQDRYQLTVAAGAKLRFEVFADRLGSPMDAVLQILNEQGGQLAINDDAGGTADPTLDYTVPANTTAVIVAVKEANGIGSPNNVYRIKVSSLTPEADGGDFRLTVAHQQESVTAGERLIVKVTAERDGYTGPIQLDFVSLPDGVQSQGTLIAADASSTLMTLHGAGLTTNHLLTSLRGTARIAEREVVRYATNSTHPLSTMQPWLGHELAIALAGPSLVDFDFGWGRIDDTTRLVLGAKLDVPLEVFRPGGFDGPVRVTVDSSQSPVSVNGRVDANRTVRSETNQPVEIAGDPVSQKAWDAKLAADKTVADAQVRQTTVAQAAAKVTADAAAKLKIATAQLATAMTAATQAATLAKTTSGAAAATGEALTKVVARVQAVASSKDAAAEGTPESSAAAVVAVAQELQTAALAKAVAVKTAEAAATKAKEEAEVLVVAQTAFTQADSAVKAAMAAEAKATADEDTLVKAAIVAQQAAATAADNAARLAKNAGTFSIFVPADLSETGYEVAFMAELLSRDKKTVLATRYSEVRRIPTLNPIVLQPATPAAMSAVIDAQAGATIVISGKVNRLAGMDQDVTVSLVGLPAGIAVPTAAVKADQADYQLEVKFPATFKPAELAGIRLFATGKTRASSPLPVRSRELPLTIQLTLPPPTEVKK
ncbi:MAG: hypothetical protein O3B13_05795 [Planctomycetota bacterium]|nr:hypothetical protein [Planctomycetota bacterium]